MFITFSIKFNLFWTRVLYLYTSLNEKSLNSAKCSSLFYWQACKTKVNDNKEKFLRKAGAFQFKSFFDNNILGLSN